MYESCIAVPSSFCRHSCVGSERKLIKIIVNLVMVQRSEIFLCLCDKIDDSHLNTDLVSLGRILIIITDMHMSMKNEIGNLKI